MRIGPAFQFATVLALMLASHAGAGERAPVPVALPSEACLSAPTQACLTRALSDAIGSLERDEFRNVVGARHASQPAFSIVAEPALDALLMRLDPKITQEHLLAVREDWRRRLAATPVGEPEATPTRTEIAAARASALMIKDAGDRSRAMIRLIQRLARHERFEAIEPLAKAVLATLAGKGAEVGRLRAYVALTAARLLRQGTLWPAWSATLMAGGFDRAVARARIDADAEDDPTDAVFEPFLDDDIPAQWLLRWAQRAQDPAYRERIMLMIVESGRKAGRRQVWMSDFAAFRQRLIAATALGKPIGSLPDAPNAEEMMALAREEAQRRGDHGFALAVKLQATLTPLHDPSPSGRDHARGFVLQAIAETMMALARDQKP